MNLLRNACGLALVGLLLTPRLCLARAGTDQIASRGQPVAARASWPRGVAELLQDPARTAGWQSWFSECQNDEVVFQFHVDNTTQLTVLVAKFAEIESDTLQIVLSPARALTQIGFGQPLPPDGRDAVLLRLGDQQTIDRWFEHLKRDENGRRVFGVHRYDKPPTALPPTLVIFVQEPAIDLGALKVPEKITISVSDAATIQAGVKIDQFLKARAE